MFISSPGCQQYAQLQTSHNSGARTCSQALLQGGCRPSLILAEVLESFGQVEPINGQPVHHTPLDHQATQSLQGWHCGKKTVKGKLNWRVDLRWTPRRSRSWCPFVINLGNSLLLSEPALLHGAVHVAEISTSFTTLSQCCSPIPIITLSPLLSPSLSSFWGQG